MSFEKLLEELDVMAKSFDDAAKDDEKIKAAAAEGDAQADAEGDHAEPDGDEDEEGNEPMGKSFAFTLENGEQIEALTVAVRDLGRGMVTIGGTRSYGASLELTCCRDLCS